MNVKILTAQEKWFEAEAKEVVLPGDDGEFSVLDFHQPCVYSLRPGQVKVRFKKTETSQGEEKRFTIKLGVAKMGIGELIILAERF